MGVGWMACTVIGTLCGGEVGELWLVRLDIKGVYFFISYVTYVLQFLI